MAGLAHAGIGFAAKWAAPKVPVVWLVVAAEALDLLAVPAWLLTFLGVEPLPSTHGLFMAAVLSVAAAVIALAVRRDGRTAVVIGFLTFSHWIVDWITHPMGAVMGGKPLPPDLPLLFSGSPRVGLGLYNRSLPLALVFDLGVTLLGVGAYVAYRSRARHGQPH